jgi:hypothetical protein
MDSSQDTEARLKAALADRYQVEREIGSGAETDDSVIMILNWFTELENLVGGGT